jgi:hypothetical protein
MGLRPEPAWLVASKGERPALKPAHGITGGRQPALKRPSTGPRRQALGERQ